MSRTFIIIKDQFAALHSWPDCPYEEVAFIRNPHRHIFYVQLKIEVSHDDRELEFFMVKKVLSKILHDIYADRDLGPNSCEMLCKDIKLAFEIKFPRKIRIYSISVSEDNENGSEVTFY